MILDDGTTTIILPDSMLWVDEYKWSDVKQSITPTIGGGMVVEESTVLVGRPITLDTGSEVYVLKPVIDALLVLINTVDKIYTLTMPNLDEHTVIFDRSSGAPFEAVPMWRKEIQENEDYFNLILKLIKA